MRTFIASLASSSLLLWSLAASAEATISQPLTQIQYDANGDNLWLIGPAKWGAPSCANATYIRITSAVTGHKQLLAIAMAAKAAGQHLRFEGSCHADPGYFNASYVSID